MSSAEVEARESLNASDAPKQGLSCAAKCGGGVCCCLLLLIGAIYLIVLPMVTDMGIASMLTIDDAKVRMFTGDGYDLSNLTYKTTWPLCGSWEEGEDITKFDGGCGEECYPASIPRAMQTSFEENRGQLVRYPSRTEAGIDTIELGGWLIPAEGDFPDLSSRPRIVVQHGFTGNSNEFGILLAAYHLRQLGFTVLLNNFRDHGYANSSTSHIYEWGGAYTYDLLGAWDYMVSDPDGLLGGPAPADKVGIMGFSMGAFMTLNAFGLESRVPVAWADSPPYRPRGVFANALKSVMGSMGMGFLAPPLESMVWGNMLAKAKSVGVDLEKNLPEKNLPMGPGTKRPLGLSTNPDDSTVPVSEFHHVLSLLEENTDKYSAEHFYVSKTCRGFAHCLGMLLEPELYLEKLCIFWKTAFKESTSNCPNVTSASILSHNLVV